MVDTSILIAIERKAMDLGDVFRPGDHLMVSTPTIAELREGLHGVLSDSVRARNLLLLRFVTENFELATLDYSAACELGYLRAITARTGKPRGPFDLTIAAIARVQRAEVLTRDERAGFAELLALPPRPAD